MFDSVIGRSSRRPSKSSSIASPVLAAPTAAIRLEKIPGPWRSGATINTPGRGAEGLMPAGALPADTLPVETPPGRLPAPGAVAIASFVRDESTPSADDAANQSFRRSRLCSPRPSVVASQCEKLSTGKRGGASSSRGGLAPDPRASSANPGGLADLGDAVKPPDGADPGSALVAVELADGDASDSPASWTAARGATTGGRCCAPGD